MNTQKKFLKVLSMLTIILLIATIFIPGNGNRNAVASIGILGILLLFLSTLLPKIYKLTLNLLKNQGKTSPWSSLKSSEPVSETEELLWRQISYQITDKLQAAFPNMQAQSFISEKSAFIQLTDMDFYMLLKRADSYIVNWENYVASFLIQNGKQQFKKQQDARMAQNIQPHEMSSYMQEQPQEQYLNGMYVA